MLIGQISAVERSGQLRLEVPITRNGETRIGFYEIPLQFAYLVDTSHADSFFLSLFLQSMIDAEDLHVEHMLSERLFYAVKHELMPIMAAFNPLYKKINITADHLDDRPVTDLPLAERGIGTGLSGGIDSLTCIKQHFNDSVSAGNKLTHLFFFNVGAHGMGSTPERLAAVEAKFFGRLAQMQKCADQIGLPIIPINSNIHSFFTVGHLECCSLVTPGTALVVQRGIRRYYFASDGHNYEDKFSRLRHGEVCDASEIDSMIVPFMSTESLTFSPTEVRLRRTDKIRLINSWDVSHNYLNVCWHIDAIKRNCSVCEKCCTAMAMLELLDCGEKFSEVFDFDKYHKQAKKYFIGKVIAKRNNEPFFADIVNTAKEKNINLYRQTTYPAIFWAYFQDSKIHNFMRNLPGLRTSVKLIKKVIKPNHAEN